MSVPGISDYFPSQTYRDLALGIAEKVQDFMEGPGEMERFRSWVQQQSENGNPYGIDLYAHVGNDHDPR